MGATPGCAQEGTIMFAPQNVSPLFLMCWGDHRNPSWQNGSENTELSSTSLEITYLRWTIC